MKKTFGIILLALFMTVLGTAFKKSAPPKAWPVPEASSTKKNPTPTSAASIANGKDLYTTHCASCHGKKGKGDGTKADQLETDCGDFSTAAFHKQSDGSIFYKTQIGRDDMPSFKKKIPDPDDIWDIVNYIRTLKL